MSCSTVHTPKLQYRPVSVLQYSPPATATEQSSTCRAVQSQLQNSPAHVLQYNPPATAAEQSSTRPTEQCAATATEQFSTLPTIQSTRQSYRTIQLISYSTVHPPQLQYRPAHVQQYTPLITDKVQTSEVLQYSPQPQHSPAYFLQCSPPAAATVQTRTRPTIQSTRHSYSTARETFYNTIHPP
jgi:hypothetical protein